MHGMHLLAGGILRHLDRSIVAVPCYGALVDIAPAQSRLIIGKGLKAQCQLSMGPACQHAICGGFCHSMLREAPMPMIANEVVVRPQCKQETDLSSIPSWDSRAQRERQKPSLGYTADRRSATWARALLAFHVNRRIKYAIVSAADRLTPAPQWISVAAHTQRIRFAGIQLLEP